MDTFPVWWLALSPVTCSNLPTHCKSKDPEDLGGFYRRLSVRCAFQENVFLKITAVMIIAVGNSTLSLLISWCSEFFVWLGFFCLFLLKILVSPILPSGSSYQLPSTFILKVLQGIQFKSAMFLLNLNILTSHLLAMQGKLWIKTVILEEVKTLTPDESSVYFSDRKRTSWLVKGFFMWSWNVQSTDSLTCMCYLTRNPKSKNSSAFAYMVKYSHSSKFDHV